MPRIRLTVHENDMKNFNKVSKMLVSVDDHRCVDPEPIHRRWITCNETLDVFCPITNSFQPRSIPCLHLGHYKYFSNRMKKDTCLFVSNEPETRRLPRRVS